MNSVKTSAYKQTHTLSPASDNSAETENHTTNGKSQGSGMFLPSPNNIVHKNYEPMTNTTTVNYIQMMVASSQMNILPIHGMWNYKVRMMVTKNECDTSTIYCSFYINFHL